MKHKESVVLKSCQDWLETNGYFYLRHNAVSLVGGKKKFVIRKQRDSQKGGPDLIIFYNGQAFPIECKSSSGKLSKDQESWAERVRKEGFGYWVVREISDLIKVVELE